MASERINQFSVMWLCAPGWTPSAMSQHPKFDQKQTHMRMDLDRINNGIYDCPEPGKSKEKTNKDTTKLHSSFGYLCRLCTRSQLISSGMLCLAWTRHIFLQSFVCFAAAVVAEFSSEHHNFHCPQNYIAKCTTTPEHSDNNHKPRSAFKTSEYTRIYIWSVSCQWLSINSLEAP
eukprot:967573-Amphidinium_carterae.1